MTQQADSPRHISATAGLLAMVMVAAMMGLRGTAESTLRGLQIEPPRVPIVRPVSPSIAVLVRPAAANREPLPVAEPERAAPIARGLPESVVPTTIAAAAQPPLATFASVPQKTALKSEKARTDQKAKGERHATLSVSAGEARRAEHAERHKSFAAEAKAHK